MSTPSGRKVLSSRRLKELFNHQKEKDVINTDLEKECQLQAEEKCYLVED
jgi:hypothetical protein